MANQPADFMGKVEKMIKLAGYNATMFLAYYQHMQGDQAEMNHIVSLVECYLPEMMAHYMYTLSNELFDMDIYLSDHRRSELEHEVLHVVSNMTFASLAFSSLYPSFTCLENLYYSFLYQLKQRIDGVAKPDADGLFDKEKLDLLVNKREPLMSCGYDKISSKCLKKMKATCVHER